MPERWYLLRTGREANEDGNLVPLLASDRPCFVVSSFSLRDSVFFKRRFSTRADEVTLRSSAGVRCGTFEYSRTARRTTAHQLGSHNPGERVILWGSEVNDTVLVWPKVCR
jgi:hypothetical protein